MLLGRNVAFLALLPRKVPSLSSLIVERVRAGLRNARAKGKRLGRLRVIVDAPKVAALRERGASWPQIAKQLGVGVRTAYRAYQELSKKPKVGSLSRISISRAAAAD